MEKYIGTKVIKARAMNLYEFSMNIKGEDCFEENRDGYLVGYSDVIGNFDGELDGGCHYLSWSPDDVFDALYKPMTGMPFGLAIEAMKAGYKVARAGWNGKGMWISMVNENNYIICTAPHGDGQDTPEGECKGLLPWIGMKTADNKFVPWLASQTDMLADDWQVAG